jgi:glycosyltransferase involved in cell wall biosynthesis
MNILLVDSVDFPFGGAHSIHVSLVIKGIRENQESVFLIIPYGRKLEDQSLNRKKYGHHNGVPYYFVRWKKDISKFYRLIDIFFGVLKTAGIIIARKRRGRVNRVILGGPDILRDSPIILTCLLCKVPIYFWFVEKETLSKDYFGLPGFLNYQSQKLSERFLPRFASGILVISSYLKLHYLKYLPESNILLSPILVSKDMNYRTALSIEKTKDKFESIIKYKRILLYSGSYSEKDGVHYLIDAFNEIVRKYPDTLFIMTGKNHNETIMDRVKEHIEHLNLQNKIKLLGFVGYEELYYYKSNADILFAYRTGSSYANYGFPWKLGEYCMIGKPIIASKVGDLGEYFKDGEDLFMVEPDNSKYIVEKIIYIFDNFNKALIVAKKGTETALRNFGYIDKTKEIIEFLKYNNETN